jgi:hypothetical protein
MDNKYTQGMIVKHPHANAPDYVKCKISIKVQEFIAWLDGATNGDEWINLNVKESRNGGLYAEHDTWKPSGAAQGSTAATATTATATECDEVF